MRFKDTDFSCGIVFFFGDSKYQQINEGKSTACWLIVVDLQRYYSSSEISRKLCKAMHEGMHQEIDVATGDAQWPYG